MLRFHNVITETTKNCPTVVLFSLDIPWKKTQKDVWTNSICVAFLMYLRSVHRIVAPKHWKCNTNGNDPNVFVCSHSTHVERKQNRRWTILRCLGNCNIKTQHHLDNSQMLTPSNVLELHLSTISCPLVKTERNHWKRKTSRNCPNGVFYAWKNSWRFMKKLEEFKSFDFPEEPEKTNLTSPELTTCLRIVQCVSAPLKRI